MSMRSVYRKIARQNGITIKELRAEMQDMINAAWTNPQNNGVMRAYQSQVHSKGEIPTPDEVIRYVACKVNSY